MLFRCKRDLQASLSTPPAALQGARVIFITFICCFPQWALSSQQRAASFVDETTQLCPQPYSQGEEGTLQCSQSHERCSSHTYLRLLHSQADPQPVADYMWLHKHVRETSQDTSSREFQDKPPMSLPSSTAAPRVSVTLKAGVPIFAMAIKWQWNPEHLPGTWISSKFFRAVISYSRSHFSFREPQAFWYRNSVSLFL